MTPARFIETRGPVWDRLETLVARALHAGLAKLSESELHELTRLYPGVAVDVARARMYKLDPHTLGRINKIAIGAHALLYRRKHTQVAQAIRRFFTGYYPGLFRRHWSYILLAAALFFVPLLGVYTSVRLRPSTAYIFVPSGLEMPKDNAQVTAEDISERFRRTPQPPMAAGIMTNNIAVAFHAFALGISAGIGTCYVLLLNGMMLGAFFGHFTNYNLSFVLWSFLGAHGFLEIFAILVAGGAGLRLGLSLAIPGSLRRRDSLRVGARDAVLLVLGTIPMFIVAGVMEAFVTPSYLSGTSKIALGLAVWLMTMAYLLTVGLKGKKASGGFENQRGGSVH